MNRERRRLPSWTLGPAPAARPSARPDPSPARSPLSVTLIPVGRVCLRINQPWGQVLQSSARRESALAGPSSRPGELRAGPQMEPGAALQVQLPMGSSSHTAALPNCMHSPGQRVRKAQPLPLPGPHQASAPWGGQQPGPSICLLSICPSTHHSIPPPIAKCVFAGCSQLRKDNVVSATGVAAAAGVCPSGGGLLAGGMWAESRRRNEGPPSAGGDSTQETGQAGPVWKGRRQRGCRCGCQWVPSPGCPTQPWGSLPAPASSGLRIWASVEGISCALSRGWELSGLGSGS